MIKVIGVKWINVTAKEAEVTISNGKLDIVCFSQPFKYLVNDVLLQPIYCLEVQNVFKSNLDFFSIEKKGQCFGYFLRGKIINLKEKLINVDGFLISLEDADIPGDLINGDAIEFTVTRLDIY